MSVNSNLRFICDEVTATLRYAESKHAVFMAFNGLAVFGGMGLLRTLITGDSDPYIKFILFGTMALLMCSMIASMYSYLPQILGQPDEARSECGDNLMFFEHVKTHSLETYLEVLCSDYGVARHEVGAFERCLIAQIIANSKLASRKFRLFKLAISFDLLAVIVGLGGMLMRNILM